MIIPRVFGLVGLLQGFERADRQHLTRRRWPFTWCRRGCMFAFVAAHRAEVFPDADYADLFAPPWVGQALCSGP